jgi:hypothetical protein
MQRERRLPLPLSFAGAWDERSAALCGNPVLRFGETRAQPREKKFHKGVDLRGMTLNNSAPRFGGP